MCVSPHVCVLLNREVEISILLSCSGASKKEEAADLYVRAANQYKVAKRFKGQ